MASIVWTRPLQTAHGPLDDVAPSKRTREWPDAKRQQLIDALPRHEDARAQRFRTCAVVGSSPEALLYEDGAEIDAHDAVFRSNLAVTAGYEKYVGNRTTVRVINPVESLSRARSRRVGGPRQGGDATILIKNQDPPSIRDPSGEHSKFLREKLERREHGEEESADFLSRRHIMELCNFMLLMSGVPLSEPALRGLHVNLTKVGASFGRFASSGEWGTWHPMGGGIPKYSGVHCSTGTVLLTEALLVCDRVRLYGYHVCDCPTQCGRDRIADFNHYWDTKPTPNFDKMAKRYESHMRYYHKLQHACELDFHIARLGHCDHLPSGTGPSNGNVARE